MVEPRPQEWKSLAKSIGNTPLVQYAGEVPQGNKIWVKRECDNPFGSHYDRVYLDLFHHLESQGTLKPNARVLETTSGAAGVSFAGIGRLLGYECFVALPTGGERAREEAIRELLPSQDHLIFTPADQYVSGFPSFLRRFLAIHKDVVFLNHSMGPRDQETGKFTNNEVTLRALERITREVIEEISTDYFIPAVGNGSSVLGPARVLPNETKVIAFETVQSAVAYGLRYPGEYEKMFGITPGTLSRHRLPGTSYRGIEFPHIINAIEDGIVDEVILVSDARMDDEYERITGKCETKRLPHWDMLLPDCVDVGRTTRAGISVALEIAERVSEKNLLVIAYDKASRYDS
ncbi:MAG TPA: pyridoxal-phosphate dependent enzyme [Candidatus Nanoarchaeia archaeon]|nr:pyridoxal-phosphate dependent enzyme [Candidatus Nanoarchaeia archaeon]